MTSSVPSLKKAAFQCPHCLAFAQQRWESMYTKTNMGSARGTAIPVDTPTGLHRATCTVCGSYSLWQEVRPTVGSMIWPHGQINAPLAHPEMPADVAADFNEARKINADSPRGAAALLRLAIQKLMPHLGAQKGILNADIKDLVEQGLPIQIQQALDIVRVTGNNAVHPGEMDFADTSETSSALFEFTNLIVENRIAEPARIAKVFASLPASAIQAIERRDKREP